ncbi:MAG: hypothetical protein V7679_03075 [Parasphingorhabdus sp.]
MTYATIKAYDKEGDAIVQLGVDIERKPEYNHYLLKAEAALILLHEAGTVTKSHIGEMSDNKDVFVIVSAKNPVEKKTSV